MCIQKLLSVFAGLIFVVSPLHAQAPLIRDFIGVNVKQHLPYDRVKRIGQARAFHLWADDQKFSNSGAVCPLPVPAGSNVVKIRWNPSYNGNRYIRYDDFYSVLPQKTVAIMHGSAPDMYNASDELFAKPICPQFNNPNNASIHADPDNWEAMAMRCSFFAARYGAAPAGGYSAAFTLSAAANIVSPDNVGLGKAKVKYIELFNESDAAWHNVDNVGTNITGAQMETDPSALTKYYFRPDQYAAMVSAAYDGNKGTGIYQNTPWGIKKLSSNTQVVLAGTADLRYDYLHFARVKWDAMRGQGDYPFDIVNYHFYATTTHPAIDQGSWDQFYKGRAFFGGGKGAFPESVNVNLRSRIKKLLNDREFNTYYAGYTDLFPDKPTWITEFGYDTEDGTPIVTEPFCGFDVETVQGQWITRYIMEASAAASDGGKKVQKVFIYELNDDPNVPWLFGSCGLLAADATPKVSWYHVRTLKSVLDATRFSKTNSTYDVAFQENAGGSVMVFDNPRMYWYSGTNLQRPTIAAWVPDGDPGAANCDQVEYHGAVLIQKSLVPVPVGQKPVVQVIEVVNYDEDGRRTKVVPELIDEVELTPPGAASPRQYWRINGIRPGDTEFTLTETPVYLRVNQPFSESDRVVPPVNDLEANCLACNTARLTWTIPQGQGYSFYNIYYQVVNCQDPVPAFDPLAVTLLVDRLPGGSTDAVVSGIQTDPGKCYIFWVLPFVSNTNGGASGLFTYSTVDLKDPQSTHHYISWEPATCEPCAVPFEQDDITITMSTWDPGSFLENAFYESLLPPDGTSVCNELASNPAPGNFGILVEPGKKVQFVINFDGPKYIDALYFFYATGNGRVTIEYEKDCCRQWIKLAPIDIQDFSSGNFNNFWYRVVNSIFNKEKIEKIRVTIEGLPETGVNIKRFYLCTRPAPEGCPGEIPELWQPNDETFTAPSDVRVEDLDTHSAQIAFNPSQRYIDSEETFPVSRYTVRYSIAIDGNGDLIEPYTLEYEGSEWGGDNIFPLSPLVPNTTYYVDISPAAEVYPCIETLPKTRIDFTTPELPSEDRHVRGTLPTPDFRLTPNPATEFLQVHFEPNVFESYRILYVNGTEIKAGQIPENAGDMRVALSNIPNGIYVFSCTAKGGAIQSKAFIVSKP